MSSKGAVFLKSVRSHSMDTDDYSLSTVLCAFRLPHDRNILEFLSLELVNHGE